MVEIKARFDEQANISWARKLEQAGVHVVYGIVGLKTHAKLSLVVRQESDGLHRYCHVGTGNYNPKTARLYEDLGLLTCDPQVGEDLSRLFNQLSGYAPKTAYRRLLVAPRSLRSGWSTGSSGRSPTTRAAGGRGSDQGQLHRGRGPDRLAVPGLTGRGSGGRDRARDLRDPPRRARAEREHPVRSVLGRFLEHSRVFWFAGGGEPVVYIGSADMMHRNLDRRVEAMVRLRDPRDVVELDELLTLTMDPGTASWSLDGDGKWTRHHQDEEGRPLRDLQAHMIANRPGKRPGRRR